MRGRGTERPDLLKTFSITLASLLDANSAGFLRHVETCDGDKVRLYASLPAATAPPVRVRCDGRIADGWHRLAAARMRGDKSVLCCSATPQEELSA